MSLLFALTAAASLTSATSARRLHLDDNVRLHLSSLAHCSRAGPMRACIVMREDAAGSLCGALSSRNKVPLMSHACQLCAYEGMRALCMQHRWLYVTD